MPALRKGEQPAHADHHHPEARPADPRSPRRRGERKAGGPASTVTEAITAENTHFARAQREPLERKYAGNPVMLAQELRGELLGEVDGCLFPIEQFNETRVFPAKDALPQWRRVVVAIDPATTSHDSSDESGIVVMAEGDDGDYYCLEDCSGKYPPTSRCTSSPRRSTATARTAWSAK